VASYRDQITAQPVDQAPVSVRPMKEIEKRKPSRHKKVLINAIPSSRI
jgi:hypothetical protein